MKRLYTSGNSIICDSGEDGENKLLVSMPFSSFYEENSNFVALDSVTKRTIEIPIADAVEWITSKDGLVYYTEETMLQFFLDNCGKQNSSTTVVVGATETGFASYADSVYISEATAFTLPAGVVTQIPNNAVTVYDDQKPSFIDSYYDGDKILGQNGNGMSLMIYFRAIPSSINSEIDIYIDIGGGVGQLYRDTEYFRGATEKGILYSIPVGYNRDTWEANGGRVYAIPSSNTKIFKINFNFSTTHKATTF